MNTLLIERAIIANMPGQPFVLVEVSPSEIDDLSTLQWQASTPAPDWQEVQQWAQALQIEDERAATEATLMALLLSSDFWGARHAEDGISMTPQRIQYRGQLRVALAAVKQAADPTSIDIPAYPPLPGKSN